jgi:hypothetical protein
MNTNTPVFRAALTLALLWLAAWGYFTFSHYREEIERLDLSRYSPPENLTDDCYASKFDFEAERLRNPTHEERQSCVKIAHDSHTQLIASSKDFAIERAWKSFIFKGALPVLGLFAIIVFWGSIANTFLRISRTYMRWLRFGSSAPRDKNTEE